MIESKVRGMTTEQLFRELESYGLQNEAGPLLKATAWAELKKRLASMEDLAFSQSFCHFLTSATYRFNKQIIGLPIPETPTRLSNERKQFALSALREELDEFDRSASISGEADALIDLAYYALGRIVEMGLSPMAIFQEVHEANMDKTRGERGREATSLGHDAVKPPGWQKPDIEALVGLTLEDARRVLGAKKEERNLREAMQAALQLKTSWIRPPKLLVIGHGRHGKDTVCEMLRDHYGLRFTSSSMFCAERIMLPYFNSHPDLPSYKTAEECFNDRHSTSARMGTRPVNGRPRETEAYLEAKYDHRTVWYDQIRAFNREDPAALAKAMLEENDVYCGMRASAELQACKIERVFDAIIWVDRSQHVGPEGRSSMTLEPWMADYVVDNNGTREELLQNVHRLMLGFKKDMGW